MWSTTSWFFFFFDVNIKWKREIFRGSNETGRHNIKYFITKDHKLFNSPVYMAYRAPLRETKRIGPAERRVPLYVVWVIQHLEGLRRKFINKKIESAYLLYFNVRVFLIKLFY